MDRIYRLINPIIAFAGDALLLAGLFGYFAGMLNWDTAVILLLSGIGALVSAIRSQQ